MNTATRGGLSPLPASKKTTASNGPSYATLLVMDSTLSGYFPVAPGTLEHGPLSTPCQPEVNINVNCHRERCCNLPFGSGLRPYHSKGEWIRCGGDRRQSLVLLHTHRPAAGKIGTVLHSSFSPVLRGRPRASAASRIMRVGEIRRATAPDRAPPQERSVRGQDQPALLGRYSGAVPVSYSLAPSLALLSSRLAKTHHAG